MNTQSIAARIKIATFSTGRPRFNKLNRKESEAIKQKHHLDADLAKAHITHCDHTALDALDNLFAEARVYHNTVTRPTIDDSCRLLPLCREMEHAAKMQEFKAKADTLAAQFIADYPQMKADAPARMNGLHDPNAWPDLDTIKSRFVFKTFYRPCPTEGEWADWLNCSVVAAQAELKDDLEKAIRRVAERCASDGKLYQSCFDNLKEILDLVPDLNLSDDPQLKVIAAKAFEIADQDKDELVKTAWKRQEVASKANALASMFGKLG